MDEFKTQIGIFFHEFGKGKKMVLSTSFQDKVTSRMMSIVQKDGAFYFQTDKNFKKYDQLVKNANVALCIDNIQIEGVCREIGHPLEDPDFCSVYQECFESSFRKYSALKNERLFRVTPLYVERWIYRDGLPFVEKLDIEKQTYQLCEYKGV